MCDKSTEIVSWPFVSLIVRYAYPMFFFLAMWKQFVQFSIKPLACIVQIKRSGYFSLNIFLADSPSDRNSRFSALFAVALSGISLLELSPWDDRYPVFSLTSRLRRNVCTRQSLQKT